MVAALLLALSFAEAFGAGSSGRGGGANAGAIIALLLAFPFAAAFGAGAEGAGGGADGAPALLFNFLFEGAFGECIGEPMANAAGVDGAAASGSCVCMW
jgi:hypothetical protein